MSIAVRAPLAMAIAVSNANSGSTVNVNTHTSTAKLIVLHNPSSPTSHSLGRCCCQDHPAPGPTPQPPLLLHSAGSLFQASRDPRWPCRFGARRLRSEPMHSKWPGCSSTSSIGCPGTSTSIESRGHSQVVLHQDVLLCSITLQYFVSGPAAFSRNRRILNDWSSRCYISICFAAAHDRSRTHIASHLL